MSLITNHNEEPIIGIDFGTTNSLIAIATNGKASIIGSAVASTVLISNDQLKAINRYEIYPEAEVVHSIKRLLGKTVINPERLPSYLKSLLIKADDLIKIKGKQRNFSPVEIAAVILKKLKHQAENYLNKLVKQAVITVPAYFGELERAAIKNAANLAGIHVLRLLAEPTAAALAYGLSIEGNYLVYDLGGGTFDLSLLRIEQDSIQVIAVGGDSMFGGDDLDQLILNYLTEKYSLQEQKHVLALELAKKVKEMLGNNQVAKFLYGELEINIDITEFEQVIANSVEYTMMLARKLIQNTNIETLDGCILVGGSSKIPLISKKLRETFSVKILADLDPESIVAIGAALQAENLINSKKLLLIDVIPLSLGLEVMGGLVEKILPRNSAIPVTVTKYFTTQVDNQTGMVLHILQGERLMVRDVRSIGRFELSGIPPLPAGSVRLAVTFSVNQDGLLEVRAIEERTGIAKAIVINQVLNFTELEIQQIIQDAIINADEDSQARQWQQAMNEGALLIRNIASVIKELEIASLDRELQERVVQTNNMLNLFTITLEQQEHNNIIQQCILDLELLAKPIIEFYANQKLINLLQGKKITDITS